MSGPAEPREVLGDLELVALRARARGLAGALAGPSSARRAACVCTRRVWSDDHVNAWVICWPRGSDTGFHDHDNSAAAIVVLEGCVIEERLALPLRRSDAATVPARATSACVGHPPRASRRRRAGVDDPRLLPAAASPGRLPPRIRRRARARRRSVHRGVAGANRWSARRGTGRLRLRPSQRLRAPAGRRQRVE